MFSKRQDGTAVEARQRVDRGRAADRMRLGKYLSDKLKPIAEQNPQSLEVAEPKPDGEAVCVAILLKEGSRHERVMRFNIYDSRLVVMGEGLEFKEFGRGDFYGKFLDTAEAWVRDYR